MKRIFVSIAISMFLAACAAAPDPEPQVVQPALPDPGESYEAGVVASDQGDFATAAERFLDAAAQGHPQAQTQLALLYETGRGVARDDTEAARLYQLAAEQGVAQAQDRLGDFYSKGQGVPEDVTGDGLVDVLDLLEVLAAWGPC